MQRVPSSARCLLGALVSTWALLCTTPALADFQSDITVRLIAPGGIQGDPTPISVSQLVNTANFATGVQAGDGGAVGDWMLAGEAITFIGNAIHVRAFAGYDDDAGNIYTGYLGAGGAHARYEFDGLSIAGQTIVGLNIFAFDNFAASGFIGLHPAGPTASDLAHWIDADTISLDLDTILFADRNTGTSNAHADFRIELVTRNAEPGEPGDPGGTLPEPATLALFAVAALGAGLARRRV
jgi:hypothetical protein